MPTPSDDPLRSSLAWRWEAGQAALELAAGGGKIPWAQIKDADIRALVQRL